MDLIKLAERQPHQLFVDRSFQLGCQARSYRARRRATITGAPHQCSGFVKAVSFRSIGIVDQNFTGQVIHDQPTVTLPRTVRVGNSLHGHPN
jgi:hypothetical protein